jgi:iron complex transport system ATP-binding protein
VSLGLRNASVRVRDARLLESVSAHWEPGAVHAVLGPNGAGKSTLLAALTGVRRLSQGEALWHGVPLTQCKSDALARLRAVVQQDTVVGFNFSAREVVELGRYPHRLQPSQQEPHIVDRALAALQVAHLAHRGYSGLSGGERARVQLARALAQIWEPVGGTPRWLLLDEPTAALDLAHQHGALRLVRQWSREQGVGVLVVLHDLNLALRYADTALVIAQAQFHAQGPCHEVLSQDLVARVWGVRCMRVSDASGVPQLLMDA